MNCCDGGGEKKTGVCYVLRGGMVSDSQATLGRRIAKSVVRQWFLRSWNAM